MPRFIIKIHDEKLNKDWYMEWSTIVDAPVTYGYDIESFKEYYKERYGTEGMRDLPERIERVKQTGCSAFPPYDNIESFLNYNRAGNDETTINKEGILERYCRNHIG